MFKGLLGGILTGGLVSVAALSGVSVLSDGPTAARAPVPDLVDAPTADDAPIVENVAEAPIVSEGVSSPVGSVEIIAPQAPELPEGEQAEDAAQDEADADEVAVAVELPPEPQAPRADTDPLDEPIVGVVEGAMEAPVAPETSDVFAQPVDPVLPNPQALAPSTPEAESDLTVSTAPAAPVVVLEPEAEIVDVEGVDQEAPDSVVQGAEIIVVDEDPVVVLEDAPDTASVGNVASTEDASDDVFVVDLTADVAVAPATGETAQPENAEPAAPRIALQGSQNTLLDDRDTGVTVRRPGVAVEPAASTESGGENAAPTDGSALILHAADPGVLDGRPLMSFVLIDDGSMPSAAAALAGLPFPVTIALDPATPGAADRMAIYRADGFEVAVLAKLPEGALPSDVEVTFEAVFSTLPESVAVLDIGDGGLQADREVTDQAMSILSAQGRGFISASEGLNMAGRAAEQAGVPAAVIYRDLDSEDQDARVVRRFVDQAAFRARQESGVVLVGRVRPDTISALILWGTANQDVQVAIVPVSAVLNANN